MAKFDFDVGMLPPSLSDKQGQWHAKYLCTLYEEFSDRICKFEKDKENCVVDFQFSEFCFNTKYDSMYYAPLEATLLIFSAPFLTARKQSCRLDWTCGSNS